MKITPEELKNVFPALNSPELIDDIIKNGILKTFEPEELILSSESYIKSVPLIISGLTKVIREDAEDKEVLLYYLKPGETCAMALVCCMSNAKSNIKAIAENETEILLIPVTKMDDWLTKHNTWKAFIMGTYKRRFDMLLETIDSIAFNNIDQRLINYLEKRVDVTGNNEVLSTHSQIASDLGTSREVVSRLLKKLEKMGNVELGRNKIVLL
jgi:CRP/FNR family transcriptional regulator